MAKHHTSNTVSVAKWCNRCKRMTQHAVSANREQHCLEDHRKGPETYQPGGVIEMPLPCMCSAYEFAHFHGGTVKPKWAV